MTSTVWARGDYPKVAEDLVSPLGPALVEACGIKAGQQVLDVGAGTGNASIPAAERGAQVIASDLTPELLDAGRERASARGVELEWAQADAQALPFDDEEFDVVLSTIGVMFAPDHQRAADELVRVCRPGGTIGLVSWTPTGTIGRFFATLGAHAPAPPAGFRPPPLWGSTSHLDELFGDQVNWTVERVAVLPCDEFDTAQAFVDYYKDYFGPTINIYESVKDDPERLEALERDFLAFAEEENRGEPDAARYEFEYLLTVGTRA
jgi:ubiquinone/menaquinone biosynthesis C-methylase UbiE